MNKDELKARLKAEGFDQRSYSIDGPLPPFEGIVLGHIDGQWRIEHFERGMRRELACFEREDEACTHMYDLLLKHFR